MSDRLSSQISEIMSDPRNQLPAGAIDLAGFANADARRVKRVPIFVGLLAQLLAHPDKAFAFRDWPEGAEVVGFQLEQTKKGPQLVFVVRHPDFPAVMPGVQPEYHLISIKSFPLPPEGDDSPAPEHRPAPGADTQEG